MNDQEYCTEIGTRSEARIRHEAGARQKQGVVRREPETELDADWRRQAKNGV